GDMRQVAAACGGTAGLVRQISAAEDANRVFPQAIPVIDIPLLAPVVSGQPSPQAAKAVIAWIETAVGLALSGSVGGVVTAPIAKQTLYGAGFAFPGHTEFLGELTAAERYDGARGPIMMLAAGDLRVALVTVHLPLAEVPQALSVEKIVNAGLVTAQALRRDFGVERPRLAVAGLNPHAGEGGAIGREEVQTVAPAVRALRDLGVDATGPHPADSLFHEAARRTYDAVLGLYHDQALIPVKMLDFWGGVNITLGLPIVRTSPDHGTAFDIAGRGQARADSMIAAIRMAREIALRRG
ncbi:4-hydroxythreonine-4-phosphate dehydrogenase PdxA, partial [Phenylobacterium sp.]